MGIIINVLISGFAVFIAAFILPGVDVTGFTAALIAAVVLGIVNAFIKPVISILALPITVLTLGLFSIVINGLMVLLVDQIVPGFRVDGFLWAIIFAFVLSIINSFLGIIKE